MAQSHVTGNHIIKSHVSRIQVRPWLAIHHNTTCCKPGRQVCKVDPIGIEEVRDVQRPGHGLGHLLLGICRGLAVLCLDAWR